MPGPTTRDRIMERLREMAADEEATGFGAMVAGLYALGFHTQLANALPEDDLEADELLEDFAQLVLELRSTDRRGRRPFFTLEQLGELRAEIVELNAELESLASDLPASPAPDVSSNGEPEVPGWRGDHWPGPDAPAEPELPGAVFSDS